MSDQTTWDGSLDEFDAETADPEAAAVEEAVPDEPDEGTATESEESDQEAPSEAPLIFGKYKDMDAAEKGHKELERQFHERQQQPEEEEEAEDDDPYGLWGTALGNDEAQQLAQRMIDRPQDAQAIFEYVEENQHQFGPNGEEITDQMFALWHAQNPRAAMKWFNGQEWNQRQEQIQAQQAPLQTHYTQQMAGLAVHRATAELPRFADFKDQIMETIQSPQMQQFLAANPEYASDPQKMFEVLQGAWTNEIAKEYRQTAQHATAASGGASTETPATKGKPRTQQRSTAAAPSSDASDDLFEPGLFNGAA